jgi:hypothetical protein
MVKKGIQAGLGIAVALLIIWLILTVGVANGSALVGFLAVGAILMAAAFWMVPYEELRW